MTEQADVSSDAIVPLQVDAASGPEQVISQKALETGARSLRANAWRDLRVRPMFWISLALIVLFLVMAIFPQLFTSKDPTFADLTKARQTPSAEAWFGYDAQGYDVYTRSVYGAGPRSALAFWRQLFSLVFGATVGIIAGYRGGWLDSLIGRIAEIFLAIPLLLGGILFLYTFPNQVDTPFAVAVGKVAFVIAILAWPTITRLMRSSVLQVKPNDYVQAARALGASPLRIINSHILPNSLASVIVVSTINLGVFISVEASLSLPWRRFAAAGDLVGQHDLRRLRARADPGRSAHAAVSQPVPVADSAVLHHAGRRRPRRPRSETSLRRPR